MVRRPALFAIAGRSRTTERGPDHMKLVTIAQSSFHWQGAHGHHGLHHFNCNLVKLLATHQDLRRSPQQSPQSRQNQQR